jgi:hypothetical protein
MLLGNLNIPFLLSPFCILHWSENKFIIFDKKIFYHKYNRGLENESSNSTFSYLRLDWPILGLYGVDVVANH